MPQVFSASRHGWAQSCLRNRIQVTELGQAGWKTLGQDPTSSRCLQNADLVCDESVADVAKQEKSTDPSARPLGTMCTYLLSGCCKMSAGLTEPLEVSLKSLQLLNHWWKHQDLSNNQGKTLPAVSAGLGLVLFFSLTVF